MSKGNSGLFQGTLGTTRMNSSQNDTSYSDRGLTIPEHIQQTLSKLKKKGDIVTGAQDSFPIKDVSIMSKETGVEFARITIGNKTYLVRGNKNGAVVPETLIKRLTRHGGTLDFHSQPYDNDCVPSKADKEMLRKLKKITGQATSQIVTPNGRTVIFNEYGVVSTGTVTNIIDNDAKQIYLKLFGGE